MALEAAYGGLTARHEIPRTVFPVVDGQPVQHILPPTPFHLPEIDLRCLDEADLQATAKAIEWDELRRPFDLLRGPMMRAVFLRLGAEERLLIQSEHHLVHDVRAARYVPRGDRRRVLRGSSPRSASASPGLELRPPGRLSGSPETSRAR